MGHFLFRNHRIRALRQGVFFARTRESFDWLLFVKFLTFYVFVQKFTRVWFMHASRFLLWFFSSSTSWSLSWSLIAFSRFYIFLYKLVKGSPFVVLLYCRSSMNSKSSHDDAALYCVQSSHVQSRLTHPSIRSFVPSFANYIKTSLKRLFLLKLKRFFFLIANAVCVYANQIWFPASFSNLLTVISVLYSYNFYIYLYLFFLCFFIHDRCHNTLLNVKTMSLKRDDMQYQ